MRAITSALVTGGAGFIGSHLVDLLLERGIKTVVLDALTYAGSLGNLAQCNGHPDYAFVNGDIRDGALVASLLKDHAIDTVFHLAAESHVDNSILNPAAFIETNVVGTYTMLEAARQVWGEILADKLFVHVSTDEVFGQLGPDDPSFDEATPYAPRSPYSASKASSDHFARAWFHTYKLPVIVTNCSNNYGARQHAEKLIPTVIRTALAGQSIPIYGKGTNIRDWLYVQDHVGGILSAATHGTVGESYCFGGNDELANLDLAKKICAILDRLRPAAKPYAEQIQFVEDRKGHDYRYSIDYGHATRSLSWKPETALNDGLEQTVRSYLEPL